MEQNIGKAERSDIHSDMTRQLAVRENEKGLSQETRSNMILQQPLF